MYNVYMFFEDEFDAIFFQIFEYESVVRNAGFANHYPVHDMSCTAKLRSVEFQSFFEVL